MARAGVRSSPIPRAPLRAGFRPAGLRALSSLLVLALQAGSRPGGRFALSVLLLFALQAGSRPGGRVTFICGPK